MCGRAVPFLLELRKSGATPPIRGLAPEMIRLLPPTVGQSRHRTSGGTAANGVPKQSHLIDYVDTVAILPLSALSFVTRDFNTNTRPLDRANLTISAKHLHALGDAD